MFHNFFCPGLRKVLTQPSFSISPRGCIFWSLDFEAPSAVHRPGRPFTASPSGEMGEDCHSFKVSRSESRLLLFLGTNVDGTVHPLEKMAGDICDIISVVSSLRDIALWTTYPSTGRLRCFPITAAASARLCSHFVGLSIS